jgi:iron complex transport system permease protein
MNALEERAALVVPRRVKPPLAIGTVAVVVGALLAGVLVGPVDIGIGEIAHSALARVPLLDYETPLSPAEDAIVWELRLPRVALGALVGAMLALAGASYQGVFRNPLADPYLLGVAAGAGLGATIAIAYGPIGADGYLLPLAAFVGAVAAVVGAYAIGRSLRF